MVFQSVPVQLDIGRESQQSYAEITNICQQVAHSTALLPASACYIIYYSEQLSRQFKVRTLLATHIVHMLNKALDLNSALKLCTNIGYWLPFMCIRAELNPFILFTITVIDKSRW